MENSTEYISLNAKNDNIIPLNITRKNPICTNTDKCSKISKKFTKNCNKTCFNDIIDSLLIITIYIFFISLFEPLFYLNYVVDLEYNFIMSKIIDESNIFYNKYMTYSPTIRNFIESFILKDKYLTLTNLKIKKDDIITYKQLQKDELYIQGIIYSSIIFGFIIILCILKYIRKSKINYCKILLENIIMILFLFIYEYIFFNNFILKYDIIDTTEINYYGLLNFINYTTLHSTGN